MNYNSQKLERLLNEMIELIETEWGGENPFESLEESLKVLKNRDFDHYFTLPEQFRMIAHVLWDNGIGNLEIYNRMDEIRELINDGSAE